MPVVGITQILQLLVANWEGRVAEKWEEQERETKQTAQTLPHFECVCGFVSVSLKCALRSTRFFCGTDTSLILLSAVRCNYFVCPSAQRSLGAPGWNGSSCIGTSCTSMHCYLRPRIYLHGEATQNPSFLRIKHPK